MYPQNLDNTSSRKNIKIPNGTEKKSSVEDLDYTLSSASRGRYRRISRGFISATITTNSDIPLLSILVAEKSHKIKNHST